MPPPSSMLTALEFHAVVVGGGAGFKKNRQKLTHIKR